MIEMYGIPNCGTIKKARQWLEAHDVDYTFHDVKKEGVTESQLSDWMQQVPWSSLLNKQSLTWRKLSPEEKADLNQAKTIPLLSRYPTMIKRPVLIHHAGIEVGFDRERYAQCFA